MQRKDLTTYKAKANRTLKPWNGIPFFGSIIDFSNSLFLLENLNLSGQEK